MNTYFDISGNNYTLTNEGNYYLLYFNENGSFTALKNIGVQFTLVGGGGGGATTTSYNCGYSAGGGGHILTSTSQDTRITLTSQQVWNIEIGSGGAFGSRGNPNGNLRNGQIGTDTIIKSNGTTLYKTTNSSYSGGGGIGVYQFSTTGGGGPGNNTTSASGGEMSYVNNFQTAGGGAGGTLTYIDDTNVILGGIGSIPTPQSGGKGGNGNRGIDGKFYGGGGGGGASNVGGLGGSDGGGNGGAGNVDIYATSGQINTGGGGGGGTDPGTGEQFSGAGGSGIAIFKIYNLTSFKLASRIDLTELFLPYTSGNKAVETGYKIKDGNNIKKDLNEIFAKI